jgi:hypothetical protein
VGNGIPSIVIQVLKAAIALVAIVAFAWMFGYGMYKVWNKIASPDNEPYLYVATSLATLVGGIVAVGFGQPPPKPSGSLPKDSFAGLGKLALGQKDLNWAAILGGIYAVVYVVFGIAAIATWVIEPNSITPLIKNQATTFLGMALPIVAAFFTPTPS